MLQAFGIGIATVLRNLLKIGKGKGLDKWPAHELNINQYVRSMFFLRNTDFVIAHEVPLSAKHQ